MNREPVGPTDIEPVYTTATPIAASLTPTQEAQLVAYRAMPRVKRREFDRAAKRALKKLRRGG
jgi:hypothetical protein